MSPKLNKTKAGYIESLSDKAALLKDSAKNIVFNFKFFYSSYPKGSRFSCPAVLSGTNAVWCRLRLTGRRRLIGFLSPDEQKQRRTFYVVFLDKNHEFAPSAKD